MELTDFTVTSFRKQWEDLLIEAKKMAEEKFPVDKDAAATEFEGVLFALYEEYAKTNFWFFVTEILGWRGLSREFHGDLMGFLSDAEIKSKLILCPRGHLKSTIGTVAYALWRLFCNPDLRILIVNYKLENAKAFLWELRSIIEMNETVRGIYSRFIPTDTKKMKWNETSILLRRVKIMKEASIEVAGTTTEVTGKHYDLIIYDDVVGPENIGTLEQVDKLRHWFNQVQAVLEPGGEQVVIGTRWHFADLYGFIEENLSEFQSFKREVYKPDGSTLWPEKFSKQTVERIENRMSADPKSGRALFLAQYRNIIVDEQTATFKHSMVKYIEDQPGGLPSDLGVTITCDPAISDKQSADRTAFVVRGVDSLHRWWVLEVVARRGMTPAETIDELFRLYTKYNAKYFVAGVGVETQAYQKSLVFQIRDRMMRDGVFLPLVELGNWRTTKEFRIRGVSPLFENGAIFFRRPGEDDTNILIDELLRFPKAPHDDAADALSMHLEIDTVASPAPSAPESSESSGLDRYGYKVQPQSAGIGVCGL